MNLKKCRYYIIKIIGEIEMTMIKVFCMILPVKSTEIFSSILCTIGYLKLLDFS